MRTLSIGGMLALVILLVSRPAYGQNLPPDPQNAKWDLSVWVAGATGEEVTNSFGEAQIWSAGLFLGRMITGKHGKSWRRGNLEYAADLVPVFETYGNQHVHGYGFDPVILRWNSALQTARVSPYLELAGGGLITNSNLPPGNTSSFNFTPKGGGGIYVRTRGRQSFDVGLRWSHISNANLGVDNPEFNGVQLSIAYHWFK
ncbi:MAG: acyloxyacyl hydrolase [Candidatus Sulfotelmatobacter sp.]